jgi:hypothetical protein
MGILLLIFYYSGLYSAIHFFIMLVYIVLMPIRIQIRISMLMPIQIRIGNKTMPILMRIIPQVLHMLENQKILLLVTAFTVLQCFIFLVSFKRVISYRYFGQHIEIFWEKRPLSTFSARSGSACSGCRSGSGSGSGNIIQIRPDLDPQH